MTVKTLRGRVIPLTVQPHDTVLQVKERLAVVEGAAPNQQRLVFAGKVMDDGKTLATFDVNNRSTLHMALKL